MLLSAQNGHFSHAWEHQPSSSLDNNNNLSSLQKLSFREHLGFLGRSLALTHSAHSLLHSPILYHLIVLFRYLLPFLLQCSFCSLSVYSCKMLICQGCNKDLWSWRSKYKSYGALRVRSGGKGSSPGVV